MNKLRVVLNEARNITYIQRRGYYWPVCHITVGNVTKIVTKEKQTNEIEKKSDLLWDQPLDFNIDSEETDYVLVQLFDVLNDESKNGIGEAWIPLGGLKKGIEFQNWHKFSTSTGEIKITLVAVNFDKLHDVEPFNQDDSVSSDCETLDFVYSNGPFGPSKVSSQPANLICFHSEEIEREYPHIAKGSFGIVYKGKVNYHGYTDKKIVIKDIDQNTNNTNQIEEWKAEIELMSKNRCPYVVEVYGYASYKNLVSIVMEYIERGSLYDLIHVKHHPLTLIQRMRMARHCALAISVLHSNNFIHRDIKSMNILVARDFTCKLTDFGCAKLVNPLNPYDLDNQSGTPLWMAPEVKFRRIFSYFSDIYSLGIVLYEIFEQKIPEYNYTAQKAIIPTNFQSDTLVIPCLNDNPQERPNIQSVISAMNFTMTNLLKNLYQSLPQVVKTYLNYTDRKEANEDDLAKLYRYTLGIDNSDFDELMAIAFPHQYKNHSPQQTPLHQSYNNNNSYNGQIHYQNNNMNVPQMNNGNVPPQYYYNNPNLLQMPLQNNGMVNSVTIPNQQYYNPGYVQNYYQQPQYRQYPYN